MKTDFTFLKKATAVFLSAVFFCLAVLSFIGIFYAAEYDFYSSTKEQLQHTTMIRLLENESRKALSDYLDSENSDLVGYYKETDFRFAIYLSNAVVLSNYTDEEILESVTVIDTRNRYAINPETGESFLIQEVYTVRGYQVDSVHTSLFRGELAFVSFLFAMRFVLIGLLAIFIIGIAVSYVYLLFVAGKHHRNEQAVIGPIEKVPFDLYVGIYLVLAYFGLCLLDFLQYSIHDIPFVIVLSILCVSAYLLAIGFSMSVAIRLKTKTLWKNTLIYIIFSFPIRKIVSLFHMIPTVWKTAVFLVVYLFADVLAYSTLWGGPYIIFMCVKYLLIFPFIIYLAYYFRKLKKGVESIENGDLEHHIETAHMPKVFKHLGETLNNIGNGLTKAVDARMRSERMKTELITNVSHDIKTPLTSIINYADLLKKEDIQNKAAAEYIDVIDRQASRLKKLITDLVEASKASTGNIQVHPEICDLSVLLEQAVGEYDEKFKEANLVPVLHISEEPIYIFADGRLLWRVFDNLLSNICKYSLPGTRVYLDSAIYGNSCIISFKNISRTELDISPEELVERFVRADHSRSTEGNGLGLSIAQSLVDLQGGTLEIVSDGDLFKVKLHFPVLKND